MSVIDEMLAYHAALAKSAKDPSKRSRLERRRDVLHVVKRLRDCAVAPQLDQNRALMLLGELWALDELPYDTRETEGPATRPMRTVGVVTATGVLTDAAEPIDSEDA